MKLPNSIKRVEFTFENLEVISVPIDDFFWFFLGDITEKLWYEWSEHRAFTEKIINKVEFGIANDAPYDSWGREVPSIFSRISQYNDICWIELIDEYDRVYRFGVDWAGFDYQDEENEYQESVMAEGCLGVVICADERERKWFREIFADRAYCVHNEER